LNTSDFVASNIAEVVSNTVFARNPNKAVIYSLFGLGILDLAFLNYIYQAAIKNDIGTVVENFLL
jgi:ornithine cyclodeaminase/alanine dehydrogenase-like protein (mu-crystallin family)